MPSKTQVKIVECPDCGGIGGYITRISGYAEPIEHVDVCTTCEGSGTIEMDYERWMDEVCGVEPLTAEERDEALLAEEPRTTTPRMWR